MWLCSMERMKVSKEGEEDGRRVIGGRDIVAACRVKIGDCYIYTRLGNFYSAISVLAPKNTYQMALILRYRDKNEFLCSSDHSHLS